MGITSPMHTTFELVRDGGIDFIVSLLSSQALASKEVRPPDGRDVWRFLTPLYPSQPEPAIYEFRRSGTETLRTIAAIVVS